MNSASTTRKTQLYDTYSNADQSFTTDNDSGVGLDHQSISSVDTILSRSVSRESVPKMEKTSTTRTRNYRLEQPKNNLTASTSSIASPTPTRRHQYLEQNEPQTTMPSMTPLTTTTTDRSDAHVIVQNGPDRDYVICQTEGGTFVAYRSLDVPKWVTDLVEEIERLQK